MMYYDFNVTADNEIMYNTNNKDARHQRQTAARTSAER